MGRPRPQFLQPAITGEAGGIAHQPAQPAVVGVLVFHHRRRQDHGRLSSAQDAREENGMRGARLQMGVAVKLEEFHGGAQECRRFLGLGGPLGRGAPGSRLSPGADDKMGGPAALGFPGDYAPAAKLDVVGMGAKSEEGAGLRR